MGSQLASRRVFDERNGAIDARNGRHFFTRIYLTQPFRVLVDVYNVKAILDFFEDGDVSEAIQKMREIAIAKAERIVSQVAAYNLVHPTERYGLIHLVGDDVIDAVDVSKASQGEIVSLAKT